VNVLVKNLATANTEYEQALTRGVRFVTLKCREAAAVRVAGVTGKVAASTEPFATLESGQTLSLMFSGAGDPPSVFLASSTANVNVELVETF